MPASFDDYLKDIQRVKRKIEEVGGWFETWPNDGIYAMFNSLEDARTVAVFMEEFGWSRWSRIRIYNWFGKSRIFLDTNREATWWNRD